MENKKRDMNKIMGKNLDAKNTVKMELLYGTQRRKETKKE
jgi:hypothetical protein